MQDEGVIFLKVIDMTEEEKSGAINIINQLVEQTDEKLCIAIDEGNMVALDTYNMSLEEAQDLLDFIENESHTTGHMANAGDMS